MLKLLKSWKKIMFEYQKIKFNARMNYVVGSIKKPNVEISENWKT